MLPFTSRWKHFAAMVLIGDGIMAIVHPQRDVKAWSSGPAPWKRLMAGLHDHPTLTRTLGAAQIVGGIWWALYQEKSAPPELEV